MRRPTCLDRIMAEHIAMPGFLGMIVTRGFAYQWMKDLGWSESERGYGSLDFVIMNKRPVDAPLMPNEDRDWNLERAKEYFRR